MTEAEASEPEGVRAPEGAGESRGRARRPGIRGSAVATARGDDGTTGLLFGGPRVSKDDPRTEAYGTVDEAVAALGLARAELGLQLRYGNRPPALTGLDELILRLQRELFVVGAELATHAESASRLEDGVTRVSEAMVEGLEALLRDFESAITMPREFVVPGESRLSAALELSRTIVRRAERRCVGLRRDALLAGEWLVPYLNRLADLLWVVARAAEQAEARGATPVRTRERGPRPRQPEAPR
ncbi:MAG TPA: cob(I)yrinic acid a,c-diamide adenosyltransferase [Candidatus Limnocylindrales bacterium]|nr:cob(I)yrinic acid a,c-diamide adenosyltransferase [Candidatus Limnocylindrales bacterium]